MDVSSIIKEFRKSYITKEIRRIYEVWEVSYLDFGTWLKSEIGHLAHCWKPEILYESDGLIIFREVEDLIAWFFQNCQKISSIRANAYRYVCREGEGCRYYYIMTINLDGKEIELLAGDATDYSGHGSYDKRLMESFLKLVLHLDLGDLPASYLIDHLITALSKKSRGGGNERKEEERRA